MLICTCLIGLSDICTYCVVYRSEQPERENVYILMEVRILSALFFNFRILTKS